MIQWVRRSLGRLFWYVRPPVILLAQGTPAECLHLLQSSAKPSRERLQLQELFAGGRRYALEPSADGFTMLTTSKQYWRYTESMLRPRRRTRASARLNVTLTGVGGQFTRLELHAHFRVFYLLDVIWIPAFFASIILPMSWAVWLRAALVGGLFGLSYIYHYFNAAYQAHEMIFFVEKVLKERIVTNLPTLDTASADVVNADFEQEWERFFNAYRGE